MASRRKVGEDGRDQPSRRLKRRIAEDEEEDEDTNDGHKENGNGNAHRSSSAKDKRRKIVEEEPEDEQSDGNVDAADEEEDEEEVNGTQGNGFSMSQLSQYPASTQNGNKGGSNAEGYKRGSIVRIRMINFVTYTDCEVRPGPRLNVVMGPNGSGKSTIVCGLALGLGGAPTILGRAKEVREFIKHGKDKATIEIELCNTKGRNVVVQRTILQDNKSQWKLNGHGVGKARVMDVMKKLNVQVDNLCQFLPQDRVCNFAALTPPQLLRETEKAVGSVEMINKHDRLIELRTNSKVLERTVLEHGTHLDNLKKANQSLERDVLRFREYEKHVKTAKELTMKKPWLEFEAERKAALTFKRRMDEVKEQIKEKEKAMRPLKQKLEDYEAKIKQFDVKKQKGAEELVRLDRQRKNIGEQSEKYAEECSALEEELEKLLTRAEENKRKAQQVAAEIQRLEDELAQLGEAQEEASQQTAQMNERFRQLTDDITSAQSVEVERKADRARAMEAAQQLQRQLKELDDLRAQKVENLRRWNKDAHNGYLWLRENENKFEKKVYGPVALEVTVPNPLHARYLEMVTPGWVITAFICQTPKDHDTLLQELYDKQKLRVSAMYNEPYDPRRNPNPCPLEELTNYGVSHFMDQVFEAPPVVKAALCGQGNAHLWAAGTHESIKHVEQIMSHQRLKYFFTPESQYAKNESRYGGGSSVSVMAVRDGRWFSGVNVQKKEELEREYAEARRSQQLYEQEISKCKEIENNARRQQLEITKEKEKLRKVGDQIKSVRLRINSRKTTLQQLEQEEDTTAEKERIRTTIKETLTARYRCILKTREFLERIIAITIEQDKLVLQRSQFETLVHELKTQSMQADHEAKQLQVEFAHAKRDFDEARAKAVELKANAERLTGVLTDELKEMFKDMPNTLDELHEAIEEARARAELSYQTNPKVITEYETRCEEINALEDKLVAEQEQLKSEQAEIEKIKSQWVPPLEELVERINGSFSKYFEAIGCAGKIQLDQHEDFDKWGITIHVKFRQQDSLHQLNAQTQSGGERSVSTMLYLISLQDITDCPFRLVDEINQGMDPRNERMIFQQVVNCACRPGLPQYFLITPKLLPDLHFTPEITVLCVFNGPWQLPQAEWKVDRFLERAFKKQ